MLEAARLRYMTGKNWGLRHYLDIGHLTFSNNNTKPKPPTPYELKNLHSSDIATVSKERATTLEINQVKNNKPSPPLKDLPRPPQTNLRKILDTTTPSASAIKTISKTASLSGVPMRLTKKFAYVR